MNRWKMILVSCWLDMRTCINEGNIRCPNKVTNDIDGGVVYECHEFKNKISYCTKETLNSLFTLDLTILKHCMTLSVINYGSRNFFKVSVKTNNFRSTLLEERLNYHSILQRRYYYKIFIIWKKQSKSMLPKM